MENPDSWNPLTKAVAEAVSHFAEHAPGIPATNVGLKAAIMTARLIETNAVATKDARRLASVIAASLKMRLANPMPMISEEKQIADAISAAALV